MFAESCQCTEASRDYRAAELPSQWAGWDERKECKSDTLWWLQCLQQGWFFTTPGSVLDPGWLTLTALVLRPQGVQHKENTASSEPTLDLVAQVSCHTLLNRKQSDWVGLQLSEYSKSDRTLFAQACLYFWHAFNLLCG